MQRYRLPLALTQLINLLDRYTDRIDELKTVRTFLYPAELFCHNTIPALLDIFNSNGALVKDRIRDSRLNSHSQNHPSLIFYRKDGS